jgi:hypothetical protein
MLLDEVVTQVAQLGMRDAPVGQATLPARAKGRRSRRYRKEDAMERFL